MRKHAICRKKNQGFTVVEVLVAMAIFMTGMIAVSSLMVQGVQLQTFAADSSSANALVKARIEWLRAMSDSDPQRSLGGSLTSNDPDHFEIPAGSGLVIRWTVSNGPSGTQDVTVAAVPLDPYFRVAPVRNRGLMP